MNHNNKIIGIWKFNDKLTKNAIIKVAKKLKSTDSRYDRIYIRKTTGDLFGIGFEFTIEKSFLDKKTYDNFISTTLSLIENVVGDNIKGWDIANSVYLIK